MSGYTTGDGSPTYNQFPLEYQVEDQMKQLVRKLEIINESNLEIIDKIEE